MSNLMITATGAEYHLSGPGALTRDGRPVRIDDIAHQLAIINRFHGATTRPYSVAEHSLLCSEIAQRQGARPITQLAALLHDAHEIYTNDLSSPAKRAVNSHSIMGGGTQAWSVFERDHERTVQEHFGLLTVARSMHPLLRRIDLHALATERRDLLPWQLEIHEVWGVLGENAEDLSRRIDPIDWLRLNTPEREAMTWRDWRQQFRDRFDEISFVLGREEVESAA